MLPFVAVIGSLFLTANSSLGQGTAFTYQGRFNDTGQPANGFYDLQFALFDSPNLPGNIIAGPLTNSATGITNGLFTVTLDFGAGVFTGPARWLELAARTNGGAAFVTLSPRQPLTPAPYAILSADVAAANTNIARLMVSNTAVTATGVPIVTSGFITGATVTRGGSGYNSAPPVTVIDNTGLGAVITAAVSNGMVISLTVLNPGSNYSTNASLTIGPPPSNAFQTFTGLNYFSGVNYLTNPLNSFVGTFAGSFAGNGSGLTNVWQISGNSGTAAGPNFLGTTDNQPLELHVNSQRALRLEPTATNGVVNVIGGSSANGAGAGAVGATIAGGVSNSIQSGVIYSVIGGGEGNVIEIFSPNSIISGGALNQIGTNSYDSTISGGNQDQILDNSYGSTIGGGVLNQIGTLSYDSTIGGGFANQIGTLSYDSTIGGGFENKIQDNANVSTISGGLHNTIRPSSVRSTIGGGDSNQIGTNSSNSTLGGGALNQIQDNNGDSTISGGIQNTIQPFSGYSTVGGGQGNTIQSNSVNSTISGGLLNTIEPFSGYSTISGGQVNTIQTNSANSTISGGQGNTIQSNSVNSTISGGLQNTNQAFSGYSTISGGQVNTIQTNSTASTIGGGEFNTIQSLSVNCAIGGGEVNLIQTDSPDSFIGGGGSNTIAAGATNSTIAGGFSNLVSGSFATVPGGFQNSAAGDYGFAAGNRAKAIHAGAFVWADSQNADFTSLGVNVFQVRCRGGVQFTSGTAGTDQSVAWAPGSGAWSFSSDRNLKERVSPVDTQAVLEKVSGLPMAEWSYKGYEQRHIGPMAQDFHAAFPLNDNDKVLNELDVQGVALAAIQGLNRKLDEKDSQLQVELREKESEIQQLKQNIVELRRLVSQLGRDGPPQDHGP
jgi:hypothetical protein